MENIETLLAAVAQTQGFDDDDDDCCNGSPLGFRNSTHSPEIQHQICDSELPSVPLEVSPVSGEDWSLEVYPLPLAAVPAIGSGEKKRRGRPPRGQLGARPPPLKKMKQIKQEDEEEDVCFICFDGGSLVLCDRKGCPKAYHPACIKRDEAFFKTKAKWNCGWHICSVCRKNSHYLCYTCTYSLCKGCTKDADYVSVRGKRGFCSTCMKTIMLIENKDQANSDSVKVDFDDKLSWEYLFKVYWVLLKEKLSLTLNELTQAKSPWIEVAPVVRRAQSRYVFNTAIDGKVSIPCGSSEHLNLSKSCEEISLGQSDRLMQSRSGTDNHVETVKTEEAEVPGYQKSPEKPYMNGFTPKEINVKGADEPDILKADNGPSSEKGTDKLVVEKATDIPGSENNTGETGITESTNKVDLEKDWETSSIAENANNLCIKQNVDATRERDSGNSGTCSSTEWATKDLQEFVAHMKNGDISRLSQFDVQNLLLDYIKRNNLRDPQRKSQIICDLRLTNLFGRARVGHIEMLKLLEYHFLIQEDSMKDSFIPAGLVGSPETNVDGNNHLTTPIKSRKRKAHKKLEERAPQNDLKEYAAIDFHNINLIYLRRNLMESLIEDKENFNDKVIGSIVRIKISGSDQKPDVHRLVQVVGTSKVAQSYSIGDKTTDIMLEVLNLDKKEAVSMASISNQGFTEDECRRLRQSIRCGLMKQFTVGEIQNKAMAIQSVKITGWLEAEILRLNHLRDRASEKGRKKELREYVQKVQLLKSPEERLRRISEVPEVHADPKMSPSYESEEDAKSEGNSKKDEYMMPNYSGFSRSDRKAISCNKKGKQEITMKATPNQMAQKVDVNGSHSLQKHKVNVNGQAVQRAGFESSAATTSLGNSPSTDHVETEKLWHYRDPNGKIQGPFSMMQLRKWSTTGLFPPDMRIWTNHEQYDSLLLIDALKGKLHNVSDRSRKASSHTVKQAATVGLVRREGVNATNGDSKQAGAASPHNAVAMSENINRQTNAAPSNHVITLSDRDSKLTNAACSSHEIDTTERDSKQTSVVSSNNGVDLSERGNKQTNASSRGIDLSERESEQTNAVLSGHGIDLSERDGRRTNDGIDLSDRDSKQKNAVSSGHGIDLSERDSKHMNAVSSSDKIDLSEGDSKQINAMSLGRGIDLSEGECKQMNAVSSGHGIDLSERDSIQTNVAASNDSVDLSRRVDSQTTAVLHSHGIDLSDRYSIQTNAASSNHAIDLSRRDERETIAVLRGGIDLSEKDSSQTNAAMPNHAIHLSLREDDQRSAVSHGHEIDLSERDDTRMNAASSKHAIDLSVRGDSQTTAVLRSHAIDFSERDGKQTNAACSNHSIDLSEREKHVEATSTNHAIDLSDGNNISVKADETNSPAWPQCWDLLKDSNPIVDNVQVQNVLHSSSPEQTYVAPSNGDQESGDLNHDSQSGEKNSIESPTENQMGNELEVQSESTYQGPVLLTAEETLRSLSIDLMGSTEDEMPHEHELHNQSSNQGQVLLSAEETLRSLSIDLMSPNDMESDSVPLPAFDSANGIKREHDSNVADLNNPMPHLEVEIDDKQQFISSDARLQTFLELLSHTPKSNDDQGGHTTDGKHGLLDFPLANSGPSWTSLVAGAELPDEVDGQWCGYSPTPAKAPVQEWDPGLIPASSPRQTPGITSENDVAAVPNNNQLTLAPNINQLTLASPSYPTSWLAMLNEPIEFDALGEESVSDLLAEVDAMESQGGFPSPTSAMKFAKELLQDCKDDCFSSIEEFSSAPHPVKSDAFSSTGEVQLTSQSSGPCNLNGPTPIDFLDTFRKSGAHSSASSEGETNNAPALSSSSEFHPPTSTQTNQEMVGVQVGTSTGSDMMDPGWGTVQGNINLVTVQGNVNLVLGGHGQGMANLNWGSNQGTPWANPNMNPNINRSPINGGNVGLPWDGQRKYEGERFTSPREWPYQGGQAGFGRGSRPPWGRQPYGNGGGYSRPLPKGQRVCKFYESGRCKKGAFCDYLHP